MSAGNSDREGGRTDPSDQGGTGSRIPFSARRRVVLSILLIAAVEAIGTIGLQAIQNPGWVNSFYFESMIATGQGPPFGLTSDTAKLFMSFMAFVSVGSVISVIVLNIAPVVIRLSREAIKEAEMGIRRFDEDLTQEAHRIEGEFSRRRKEEAKSPPK